jgi:bacterioferritin-associated ferredoxin
MARLDTAMTKAVNEMLKDARDVEIYSISAFAVGSDIAKCLNDVKTVLTRNKGKDVTVVVSVR